VLLLKKTCNHLKKIRKKEFNNLISLLSWNKIRIQFYYISKLLIDTLEELDTQELRLNEDFLKENKIKLSEKNVISCLNVVL
jgi:hypothetical protein